MVVCLKLVLDERVSSLGEVISIARILLNARKSYYSLLHCGLNSINLQLKTCCHDTLHENKNQFDLAWQIFKQETDGVLLRSK